MSFSGGIPIIKGLGAYMYFKFCNLLRELFLKRLWSLG